MTARVVVVGGGITGLAAAERLTSAAPDARVMLLEERGRMGGHIRTERAAGFVMEVGPDVFLAAKPAAVELCRRLGIAERIVGTSRAAAGSFILRRGRLVPVPAGMSGLVPSQLRPFATTPLLSLFGFAGVLELIGGLLIAVGLLTRPVAFLLSGQMAVAYFMQHFPNGFWPIQNQGELAALYCFVFLYLSARGPGRYSLDAVVFRKHMEADYRRPARL